MPSHIRGSNQIRQDPDGRTGSYGVLGDVVAICAMFWTTLIELELYLGLSLTSSDVGGALLRFESLACD